MSPETKAPDRSKIEIRIPGEAIQDAPDPILEVTRAISHCLKTDIQDGYTIGGPNLLVEFSNVGDDWGDGQPATHQRLSGVVYHFLGWLTSREQVSGPFSGSHNASQAAELASAYCEEQGWARGEPHMEDLKPGPRS